LCLVIWLRHQLGGLLADLARRNLHRRHLSIKERTEIGVAAHELEIEGQKTLYLNASKRVAGQEKTAKLAD